VRPAAAPGAAPACPGGPGTPRRRSSAGVVVGGLERSTWSSEPPRRRLRQKTPARSGCAARPTETGRAPALSTVEQTPSAEQTPPAASAVRKRLRGKSPDPRRRLPCSSPALRAAATPGVAGTAPAACRRRLTGKSPDPRQLLATASTPLRRCSGPRATRHAGGHAEQGAADSAAASLAVSLIGTPEWRALCRKRGLSGSGSRSELAGHLLAAGFAETPCASSGSGGGAAGGEVGSKSPSWLRQSRYAGTAAPEDATAAKARPRCRAGSSVTPGSLSLCCESVARGRRAGQAAGKL